MMRYQSQMIFVGALVLSGCATPYPDSINSALQVNDSVFEIRASGNGDTSPKEINDHILLKASELCQDKKFSFFIPMNRSENVATASAQLPITTNCIGGQCFTSGGGTISSRKPRATITVKMFTSEEERPDTAYNCSMIYGGLAPIYIQK